MTASTPDAPEGRQVTFPFDIQIGEGNQAEIIIHAPNGDLRLGDFLPGQVIIRHTENTGSGLAIKTWDRNNKLTQVKILVNMSWVQQHPSEGIPVLVHEIGHALSTRDKEVTESVRLPENPTTVDEVEQIIDLACNAASGQLEEETEAWNYGKPSAMLFGLDEMVYESMVEEGTRICKEAYYLFLKRTLEKYVERYEENTRTQFSSSRAFKLYDMSLHERVDLTYDLLRKLVSTASQEQVEKAAAPQESVE